ncbi:hypothetical protein [Paracidovorax valerianellae]|nr:hypothetical protein [Paracidovorax valerianellae]MDA8443814.1 hypothetical protein [Paracidovorax valerianellae]
MRVSFGDASFFQINIAIIDGFYGNFCYVANNKIILNSDNDVSIYDEIFSQIGALSSYDRIAFLGLPVEIAEEFIYLAPISTENFNVASVEDRIFQFDMLNGAKLHNPLCEIDVPDVVYDIPSKTDGFPVFLFDLSSSRKGMLGPFLYNSGDSGVILWKNLEQDGEQAFVDIFYLYAVYWAAMNYVDDYLSTWKFPEKMKNCPVKCEAVIPIVLQD